MQTFYFYLTTKGLFHNPLKRRFENSTNKKTRKQAWHFFLIALFIRDHEGIRTPNHQSRNLIFYPVELRSHYTILTKVRIYTLTHQILFHQSRNYFSVCFAR